MFDIVTGKFRNPLHYFEHLRDGLLQDFCFFADNIIGDLVRQRQNPLQLFEKARRNLVAFVLFLQELNVQTLLLLLIRR